jgi:hypothetical protein
MSFRSYLYKLLKQQPVQILTASESEEFKAHLALFTESSLNGTSTPPLKAIEQTTTTLRDFSKSLPKLTDHSTYLYAVNGQRMEKCLGVRNRLIK